MATAETPATAESAGKRESGRTLREPSDLITPMSIRVAGRAELSFVRLPDVVRNGTIVAYSAQYGTSFREDLGKEPSSAAHFDQVMADGTKPRYGRLDRRHHAAAVLVVHGNPLPENGSRE